MSKHTVGPWRVGGTAGNSGEVAVMGGDGERVGTVDDVFEASTRIYHEPRERGEAEANARLIASAPELLAAAQAILAAGFEDTLLDAYDRSDNAGIEEFTDLINAVRKATGA